MSRQIAEDQESVAGSREQASEDRLAEALGEPSAEVKAAFAEASHLGDGGGERMVEKLRQHSDTSPQLSGGDVDAAWEDAAVGEESVAGDNPTPDQDEVDELGAAMGIEYEQGERLHTTEKIERRDLHRWELDPASSEGFAGRVEGDGDSEKG
jgi:hypothetical protein